MTAIATATANSLTITRSLKTLAPTATAKIIAAEVISRPVRAMPGLDRLLARRAGLAAASAIREKRKIP